MAFASSIVSFGIPDCQFLQQHIESLKALIDQKDKEIHNLIKLTIGLQNRLSESDNKSVNEGKQNICEDLPNIHFDTGIIGSGTDQQAIAAQYTANLASKNIRIEMLTIKMIKLQNELFVKLSNNSKIFRENPAAPENSQMSNNSKILNGSKASQQTILNHFEKILPFLYPEMELNDILACRKVCHGWQIGLDTFLNNQSSLPFDKISMLKSEASRNGQNKFLVDKLDKAYMFSDWQTLRHFTWKQKGGKIIGSSVCLNNMTFLPFKLCQRRNFLKAFGVQIKHLRIRQFVQVQYGAFFRLRDHVDYYIKYMPNLTKLSLVLCFGDRNLHSTCAYNTAEDMTKAKVYGVENFKNLHLIACIERSFGVDPYVPGKKQIKTIREIVSGKLIRRTFVFQISDIPDYFPGDWYTQAF